MDADLREANLTRASLVGANLRRAVLTGADLREAQLRWADLRGAVLEGADMRYSSLVETDLRGTNLCRCNVYGISVWDLRLDDDTNQECLVIAPSDDEQGFTVDNLEVAQFLYLILNNKKLTDIIKVMRTSAVLILGSFSDDSIEFLEVMRDCLSESGYLPMIFNFDTSKTSIRMETVQTLALLSNFVIVDLSEPAGQLVEYANLVPTTHVPFIKIARDGTHVTSMVAGLYPWTPVDIIRYPPVLGEAKAHIPSLLVNEIVPCADKINEKLYEDRKIIRAKTD